ncbi:hypothetical protein RB596_008103 [Gaeumannomyces avenae]
MASTRNFQKTQVTVLTLVSSIFFARGLLHDCFQSVGKVTLANIPHWQDLLRWESRSKKTRKPVAFGPKSVVLLKYNTKEDFAIILKQLDVIMPMVEDESLVKIHICLFDANDLDPKHMVEHFTIKIRHESTGVSTVSVSWAGSGMGGSGMADGSGSIENLLQRLPPIQGRVYAGIWHQAREGRPETQDSQLHLDVVDDVLAGKPGYVCSNCVSIDILPKSTPPHLARLASTPQPDPAPMLPDMPDFPSNFDELAEKRWQ